MATFYFVLPLSIKKLRFLGMDSGIDFYIRILDTTPPT